MNHRVKVALRVLGVIALMVFMVWLLMPTWVSPGLESK